MKIAIATDNNQCSDHFGHCEGFKLYDVVNGKIEHEDFIKNPGHKPGFLPNYLSGRGGKHYNLFRYGKLCSEII